MISVACCTDNTVQEVVTMGQKPIGITKFWDRCGTVREKGDREEFDPFRVLKRGSMTVGIRVY